MDPLSAAGLASSIAGLVDLTAEVISYLYAVRGAGEEKRKLLSEIDTVYSFFEKFCEFIAQPNPFPESHRLSKRLANNEHEAPDQPETGEGTSHPKNWASGCILLLQKEGILEQCRTELASLSKKLAAPENRGQRFIKNLQWPIVREDIKRAVEGLHRLRTLIDSAQLMQIQSDLHEVRGFSASSHTILEKKEARELRKWLSLLNFPQEQETAFKAHCPGTGARLLESDEYKQWKAGKDLRLMWCSGGPGSGKTVLASIVANDLMTSSVSEVSKVDHNSSPEHKPVNYTNAGKLYNRVVLVAYCKIDDPKCQDLANIIGDLLRQSLQGDEIPDKLKRLFDKPAELGKPLCDQLMAVLGRQLGLFERAYLVIDALDEIAAPKVRSELLDFLNDLAASVMILSRGMDDIETAFSTQALCNCCDNGSPPMVKDCDHCKICLPRPGSVYQCEECVHERRFHDRTDICLTCYEGGFRCQFDGHRTLQLKPNRLEFEVYADENDLKRYVLSSAAVKKWGKKKGKAGFEDSYMVKQIVKQSQQLFLVARLVVERIENCSRRSDVRRVLEAESVSLVKAFDDTIRRIRNGATNNAEIAWEVLRWMFFSKRPLWRGEMQHALAIQVNTDALEEGDLIRLDHLISVCAGLIRIDENGFFRFIHSSVKPYLLEQHTSKFEKADEWIAERCLTYLQYEEFRAGPCSTEAALEARRSDYPFYSYAVQNWYRHMQDVTSGGLWESASSLWQDGKCVASARQNAYGSEGWPNFTVLHYAAWLRATNFADDLIRDHVSDLNTISSENCTPLRWTLFCNNEIDGTKFAQRLIEAGADFTSFDKYGEALFHYAARRNKEEIFNLLVAHLQKSKEPQTKSVDQTGNKTGAIAPAAGANTGLNLRTKATDNSKGGDTALTIAARFGNSKIVQHLIKADADLLVRDSDGNAALHNAVIQNHAKTVTVLLDAGVDVNILTSRPRDDPGMTFSQTPLIIAAIIGHIEIVQLLIKAGADLLVRDSDGDAALHYAIINNHGAIVTALLDAGVDVNILTSRPRDDPDMTFSQTPLIIAAICGDIEIVQLLIKAGADLLVRDSDGNTALHNAIINNHGIMVTVLLDAGVDVNILTSCPRDDPDMAFSRTPIMIAVVCGDIETVQLLIKAGADLLVRDSHGNTALSYSVKANLPSVVIALLTAKVDPSSSTSEKAVSVATRQTVLMDAVRLGHVEIVDILLRGGASPLISDEKDMTAAFHRAIYFEQSGDVEKLWELNASKDHNEATCKAESVLEYAFGLAAWCGRLGPLKFLLEKGVSPNSSVTKPGMSALMEALAGGKISAAELLLQQDNIDVRMKSSSGRTALHYLFGDFFFQEIPATQRLSLAQQLVKAGANIYEKDNDGLTAIYYTADSNCTEGLRYLLNLDLGRNGKVEKTERASDEDMMEVEESNTSILRRKRFNLEASCLKSSMKLLQRFACRQNFEAVQLLIEHGAKVSTSKDDSGLSAIDDALYHGQKEMIELFMKIEPDHPTLQKTNEAGFLQLIKKSPDKVEETVALEESQTDADPEPPDDRTEINSQPEASLPDIDNESRGINP